jgi:hypothetical protein
MLLCVFISIIFIYVSHVIYVKHNKKYYYYNINLYKLLMPSFNIDTSHRKKTRSRTFKNKRTQLKTKTKTKKNFKLNKHKHKYTRNSSRRRITTGGREPINATSVAAQRRSLDNPRLEGTNIKKNVEAITNAANNTIETIKDHGKEVISSGVKSGLESVGIDVIDPTKAQSQLNNFGKLMSSEKNREKMVQIGKDVGKIGVDVAVELLPLAEPLIDESINVASEGARKAIDSVKDTGKYALTSVFGPIAGVPFAIMSAVDAGTSVVDTGSKVITNVSDTINASIDISNKIIDEQKDIVERIALSASEFSNAQAPSISLNGGKRVKSKKGGATRKSCLKSLNKYNSVLQTKKVRFNKLLEFNSPTI